MVLGDDAPGQHTKPCPATKRCPYYPPGGTDTQRERGLRWKRGSGPKSVQPGSFATTDFDFEKPRKSLGRHQHDRVASTCTPGAATRSSITPPSSASSKASQTEATAKIRIEELQVRYLTCSRARQPRLGDWGPAFASRSSTNYPRKDLNIEYLITQETGTRCTVDSYETGGQPPAARSLPSPSRRSMHERRSVPSAARASRSCRARKPQ